MPLASFMRKSQGGICIIDAAGAESILELGYFFIDKLPQATERAADVDHAFKCGD